MTSIRWCAVAVALASGAGGWGQSQFWGELRAGKYGVGFRSLYQLDVARRYNADYIAPTGTEVKKPRPIFLAVWYPAAPLQDKAMLYRDYFHAVTVDSAVAEFAQRLRKFTRDTASRYMTGKEFDKLTEEERAAWDALLATPVFATLNVPAAAGRFPVVIYHPGLGGTFDDNSVACEFLASHGYVVLSSGYQAADSSSLPIDGDLGTSLEDLNFVLRYAATLPFADLSRVAAMGHDYGAQAMLAWRARSDSAVDAVVFLDSSVEYRPLDDFADFKAALERNRNSTVPVVMFGDRRRNPRFASFEAYLKFAAHYEASVDGLEHNDFVSQGAIGKSDAVRRNYEAVCEVILGFLNGHLKGDEEALKRLRTAAPGGLLQLAYKESRAAPPTSAQVVKMYSGENLAALAALVKQNDADLVVDASTLLFDDGRKLEALSLLKWAAPLLPRSAEMQRALGDALLAMGDKRGARSAFEKALEFLPEDGSLDAGQKARTRKAVEEGFKVLLK
jgi:tetratricopeptide (TPR) repeat protein